MKKAIKFLRYSLFLLVATLMGMLGVNKGGHAASGSNPIIPVAHADTIAGPAPGPDCDGGPDCD